MRPDYDRRRWRIPSWLPNAILGIILLSVGVLLFSRMQIIDGEQHVQYSRDILRLNELNARIDQDILQIRLGVLANYDSLTQEVKALEDTQARVAQTPTYLGVVGTRELGQLHEHFAQTTAQRKAMVEHFKSENAVLKNSVNYMPVVTREVIDQLEQLDADPIWRDYLENLLESVLGYCISGQAVHRNEVEAYLRVIDVQRSLNLPVEAAEGLDRLLIHTQIILAYMPLMDELTDELGTLSTVEQGDLIFVTYSLYYEQAVSRFRRQMLTLYGILVVLFGWISLQIVLYFRQSARRLIFAKEELQEALEAVQIAEEKYRGIFENATEGIFQASIEGGGCYLSVNPAMARILGFESPKLVYQCVTNLREQIYLDTGVYREFMELLEMRDFVSDFQCIVKHRDGRTLWTSQNVLAVRNSQGALIRYEGVMQDISRRKEVDRVLGEYSIDLEKQVKSRTKKLRKAIAQAEKARIEAEAANEAKGVFLSSVSHELRTPLTSILGFAKLTHSKLEKRFFSNIDDPQTERAAEQVRANLRIIVEEGERLTKLIDDVLDLAKIESGRLSVSFGSLSLEKVIDRAISATRALFDQAGLDLEVEIEPDLPAVHGDEDRLHQVLLNLLSNAQKFTPQGKVICRAVHSEGLVIVSVQDTGIGIPPEALDEVFDKFRQVGETLTNKPMGTGLGLSICWEIISLHRGRIWVTSEEGVGSTFFFSLPIPRKSPVVPSGEREPDGEPSSVDGGGTLPATAGGAQV